MSLAVLNEGRDLSKTTVAEWTTRGAQSGVLIAAQERLGDDVSCCRSTPPWGNRFHLAKEPLAAATVGARSATPSSRLTSWPHWDSTAYDV